MVVVFVGNQGRLGLSWNGPSIAFPVPCVAGVAFFFSLHCLNTFVLFLNTLHLSQVLTSVCDNLKCLLQVPTTCFTLKPLFFIE